MTWLEEHIFPAETKLNKEMVYQATLLSIAEMIKSGTTSFCDMYLFAGEVARAVDETGIRAWLGEVLYDFPSPSYGVLNSGYALVRELFEQYRDHDLITITVAPHSVYTCAPALLEHCAALADEFNSRYVIHLSETDTEVATCRQRYGVSPVDHLHQLGLLNDRVLAAHCVKLSSKEIAVLAKHRVKVSHCLESNLKLASGVAPVPEMLASGVTVSIGTDGPASNNDVDMFSEMSSVAKVHKVVAMDPTVMDAETTLRCATLSGAEALGSEQQIGTLSAGKKADIIVLDLAQPHLTPIYNIASHLVYTARGGDVMHSLINGRLVMQNRELLRIDEQAVISAMQDIRHSVLANRA
jgi:5-methylthioadenosine/S-adenosylhomocysteine deaminase